MKLKLFSVPKTNLRYKFWLPPPTIGDPRDDVGRRLYVVVVNVLEVPRSELLGHGCLGKAGGDRRVPGVPLLLEHEVGAELRCDEQNPDVDLRPDFHPVHPLWHSVRLENFVVRERGFLDQKAFLVQILLVPQEPRNKGFVCSDVIKISDTNGFTFGTRDSWNCLIFGLHLKWSSWKRPVSQRVILSLTFPSSLMRYKYMRYKVIS